MSKQVTVQKSTKSGPWQPVPYCASMGLCQRANIQASLLKSTHPLAHGWKAQWTLFPV